MVVVSSVIIVLYLMGCLLVFVQPGLGTSTSQEAKEYFSDMQRHRIPFKYSGPEDDEAITLVRFSSFLSQCDLDLVVITLNLEFIL